MYCMKMKEIAIYLDAGVSQGAYHKLVWALRGYLKERYLLRAVSHRFFSSNGWEPTTALVIFPGGRDLPYHQRLQGEGNARISHYVREGGRFLGLCAGAYYGAALSNSIKGEGLRS